jgi:hypothetical protein
VLLDTEERVRQPADRVEVVVVDRLVALVTAGVLGEYRDATVLHPHERGGRVGYFDRDHDLGPDQLLDDRRWGRVLVERGLDRPVDPALERAADAQAVADA